MGKIKKWGRWCLFNFEDDAWKEDGCFQDLSRLQEEESFSSFFGGKGEKSAADKASVCWNERPASLFISSAKGSQLLRPSDGREERKAAAVAAHFVDDAIYSDYKSKVLSSFGDPFRITPLSVYRRLKWSKIPDDNYWNETIDWTVSLDIPFVKWNDPWIWIFETEREG